MYTEWTEEVRADFLKHLAETGSVSDAARRANVSRTHAYKLRALDLEFELAWVDAEILAEMAVEYEARRRALEIIEEPMLQKLNHRNRASNSSCLAINDQPIPNIIWSAKCAPIF